MRPPEPYGHHGPKSPSGPHSSRPQGPSGPHGPFPSRGPGMHNGPLGQTSGTNDTKAQVLQSPKKSQGGSPATSGDQSASSCLSSPQPQGGDGPRPKEDTHSQPGGSQLVTSRSDGGSSTSSISTSQQSAEADRVGFY